MKLGRISLDLNYIVDMDNDDMVAHATEALYEDLMQGVKYGDLANWIRISEDKEAKEDMIPEFLLEEKMTKIKIGKFKKKSVYDADIEMDADTQNYLASIGREVITEEQYKGILIESTLKDTLNDLKINSGVLFTFGTGIGAFLGPVERLLSGSGVSMNEKDIILLIITSFALIIKDSEGVTLLEKVREKGLMPLLKSVINFITNVKDVLNAVAKNLIGVTYSLLDILGFALLLNPTMKIIDDIIKNNNISSDNVERLLSGAALSATVFSLKSSVW